MLRPKTLPLAGLLSLLLLSPLAAKEEVRWAPSLEAAINMASRQNQLVLIHFWAPDCPPCRVVEADVFSRRDVADAIGRDFVPVKINAAAMPDTARRYDVDRWPTDVVITPAGYPVHRMISPQDAKSYMDALYRVAAARRPGGENVAAAAGAAGATANAFAPGAGQGGPPSRVATWQDPQQADARQAQYAANSDGAAEQQDSQYSQRSRFTGGGAIDNPYVAGPPAGSQPRAENLGPAYANQYSEQGPGPQFNRPATGPGFGDPRGGQFQEQQISPPGGPADTRNPYINDAPRGAAPQSQPPIQPPRQPAPQVEPQGQTAKPPLGLDGHCPVTLVEEPNWEKKWQQGDPKFGVVHRGRVYLFVSEAAKQRFWQDPDRFAPILSGNDPVVFAESGQLVPGERKHGVFFRNQIYLFSSEQNLQRFWSAPQKYADTAREAMVRASQPVRR